MELHMKRSSAATNVHGSKEKQIIHATINLINVLIRSLKEFFFFLFLFFFYPMWMISMFI